MNARAAGNGLAAYWQQIPEFAKVVAGLLTGIGTTAVAIGWALNIPERLTTTEITVARHTTEIAVLQTDHADSERRLTSIDHRIDYLICLIEAQYTDARRTQSQCAADYVRGR
jgi:hypothetical protein